MITLAEARARDAGDPLRAFRDRFALPHGIIYLDGNSLGALPRATIAGQRDAVERQWGEGLVRSWNDAGWIDAPARIGAKIAGLIGAGADEVIVADSTSANLFKLLVAAATLAPDRPEILSEAGNFPTDLHIADGVARLLPGRRLRVVAPEAVEAAIGANTAVVLLTHVHYKSAARRDMAAVTARAAAAGARTLWDLSHSVGAVPLDLGRDGVELAVGCGYKYLNGSPGAPAFLYAARALHDRLASPLSGWMGHAAPFAFTDDYAPGPGMARFLCGTPPMLSLIALETGVDLMREADRDLLWEKSCALFDLFADLAARRCPQLTLASPRDPARRGSHIAFVHSHAHEIVQALIERGVVGDFRAPDVARFGLTPLYLGHEDIWRAVDILAEVLATEAWRDPRHARRSTVT